ncbi:hypothetical protein [Desulfuromusa kysingii]|nr:hypothetical protein [Desulfuromusa kysingii]
MQINSSYILDHSRLAITPSGQSASNQATEQAKDSYAKNTATAQVIDAEYVDTYNPKSTAASQEKKQIPQRFPDVGTTTLQLESSATQNNNSIFSKYQTSAVDTPPPGSYLNIFA